MDFYQIMGVSKDADAATIKKEYRKLVKEYHPDTHPGDEQAAERFKQIAEAYAVLGDDEKRKLYDQELAAAGVKKRQNSSRKESPNKPFDPMDFQREFENLFSFGGQQPKSEKSSNNQGTDKVNPLDTSAIFERYMGFKI